MGFLAVEIYGHGIAAVGALSKVASVCELLMRMGYPDPRARLLYVRGHGAVITSALC